MKDITKREERILKKAYKREREGVKGEMMVEKGRKGTKGKGGHQRVKRMQRKRHMEEKGWKNTKEKNTKMMLKE